MSQKKLGAFAGIFYALYCIFSFGWVWVMKVVIQKAIIDANNSEK